MNKDDLTNYGKMKEQTRAFYCNKIGVEIPEQELPLAVQSLTMPQYAKIWKDKNKQPELYDHTALATVGDAYLDAYILRELFPLRNSWTKDDLTVALHGPEKRPDRGLSTNTTLQKTGKELLENHLFSRNNDLPPDAEEDNTVSKKGYATAFEAVVGFLWVTGKMKEADDLLEQRIKPLIEERYRKEPVK